MDWFFRDRFRNNVHDFLQDNDNQDANNVGDKEKRLNDTFDTVFSDPFDTMGDTSHDIFQRMDEMLNKIFFPTYSAFGADCFNESMQEENDPRSMMLKDPNSKKSDQFAVKPSDTRHSAMLVDNDIDEKVAKNRWLLDENPLKRDQPNFSFKRFSSSRTFRMADGKVEEHHTVKDGSGNVTSTIRRSIGDKTHEVTTRCDESGLKEKLENFTNLDENELENFERQWKRAKAGNEIPALYVQPKMNEQTLNPPTGDPSYLSLFKKFFGI